MGVGSRPTSSLPVQGHKNNHDAQPEHAFESGLSLDEHSDGKQQQQSGCDAVQNVDLEQTLPAAAL
jgi:hypothetical protein